jgi:hypothetical protein
MKLIMVVDKTRLFAVVKKSIPLVFLILGLLYVWRPSNWFAYIPSYGDVLEVTWGSEWYLSHLANPTSAFHYPLTFYPSGWDVRTFPQGPGVFLVTLPLTAIGGAAFATNISGILAICIAFTGVYFLLNPHIESLSASTGAFLYAFWDFRYMAHFHMFLGTALLPWILFFLEKGRTKEKRRWPWFIAAGVLWGLAANMQLYFVWLGAITALLWLLGHKLARNFNWREFLSATLIVTAAFLIVALPNMILLLQSDSTITDLFDIYHLNSWSASLNSIFIPPPVHPIFKPLSRAIYTGVHGETGGSNVGLFAAIAVLVGFWRIPNKHHLTPIFILTGVGLILGLGPFLKWNNNLLRTELMVEFNEAVWALAYKLKPALLEAPVPRPAFAETILLPEFFIAAVVPFWEGVRTVSRFVLVGGLGFFLIVAFSIDRIKYRWLKYVLVGLVLFEALSVPFSLRGVPLETDLHDAYRWLRDQEMSVGAMVDLHAVAPETVSLFQNPSILWASAQHGKYNASGTGSVWPEHTIFLRTWLNENHIAAESSTSSKLLASYDVRYLFLHMTNKYAQEIIQDLDDTKEFSKVGCFDPPSKISPWNYPICVIENRSFTQGDDKPLFYKNGWGGLESWGVWGTNEASRLDWIATEKRDHQLVLNAAPYCIDGILQELDVYANGEPIFTHNWTDCEPIQESLVLPEDELEIGWNNIVFRYGYAAKPSLITSGEIGDERELAIAFNEIIIRTVSPR